MLAIMIISLIGFVLKLIMPFLSDKAISFQNEFLTTVLIISMWQFSVAWGITFLVLGATILIFEIIIHTVS